MTNVTDFIVVLPLLILLLFAQVDSAGMRTQYNQADHIKNQYLDVVRLKGCLEDSDKEDIVDKLEALGFENIQINIVDSRDDSIVYDEDNRAIRKISDDIDDIPEIKMTIKGNFKKDGLWLSRVIDKNKEETEKVPFALQGVVYTEYIDRQ